MCTLLAPDISQYGGPRLDPITVYLTLKHTPVLPTSMAIPNSSKLPYYQDGGNESGMIVSGTTKPTKTDSDIPTPKLVRQLCMDVKV